MTVCPIIGGAKFDHIVNGQILSLYLVSYL